MKRLILSLMLSSPLVAAAETARPAYTPPPPVAMSSGSVMQIILSLILVLGTVAIVAWMMKRINLPQHGAASLLKVISGVAVGPRERVVLVEVSDTWLILGVAQGQVRTLHTMPKGQIPAQPAHSFGNDGKFQVWLKQMVEKRNAS
jgi:flagellar protein FliO/FliZ